MGKIGRSSIWLATGFLIIGGCATRALQRTTLDPLTEVQTPPPTGPTAPAVGPPTNSAEPNHVKPAASAAAVQAVLISDLAKKKGFSPEKTAAILTELRDASPATRPVLTQLVLEYLSAGAGQPSVVQPTVLQPQPARSAIEGLIGASSSGDSTMAAAPRSPSDRHVRQPSSSGRGAAPSGYSNTTTAFPRTRPAAAARQTQPSPAAAPDAPGGARQIMVSAGGQVPEQVARLDPSRWSNSPASVTGPSPQAAGQDGTARTAPKADPTNWRKQVRQVIRGLETQLQDDSIDDTDRFRMESYVGLLYLISEDREKALAALHDYRDEQELEFWRQTLMGLGILLNPDELPKFKYRAESAAECFRQGEDALASLGPLHLNNLTFCTKVTGFGDYEEFASYAFRPGQQVLLYIEVENYTVEPIEVPTKQARGLHGLHGTTNVPMYETELHGRYEILDAQQRTVASRILPVDRNRCRNHRRDYFIPYMLSLPDKISSGSYTLELVIEDKKGNKFGNAVIDFRIR